MRDSLKKIGKYPRYLNCAKPTIKNTVSKFHLSKGLLGLKPQKYETNLISLFLTSILFYSARRLLPGWSDQCSCSLSVLHRESQQVLVGLVKIGARKSARMPSGPLKTKRNKKRSKDIDNLYFDRFPSK